MKIKPLLLHYIALYEIGQKAKESKDFINKLLKSSSINKNHVYYNVGSRLCLSKSEA